MDYKYIEQLLERYWDCETSLEEEQILRTFFCQKQLPRHLLRYRELFAGMEEEKHVGLGAAFDARMLALVEAPVVKAGRLTFVQRCMPLFKAAALVAVLLVSGALMQHAGPAGTDAAVYAYDEYRDSTSDPQVACRSALAADTVLTKNRVQDIGD